MKSQRNKKKKKNEKKINLCMQRSVCGLSEDQRNNYSKYFRLKIKNEKNKFKLITSNTINMYGV